MCAPLHPEGRPNTASSWPKEIPNMLPPDKIAQGAYDLAKSILPESIFNHSIRVALLAKWLAERERSEWASPGKLSLLAVACLLHDVGCAHQFDGAQRFEVEGADAAASYLRQHEIPKSDIHEVWQAIALHTSPGIAERISSCARLVRQAVLLDFGKSLDQESQAFRQHIEESFPRIGIEKVLGDVVVDQALRQPQKAPPASWPGILLRAKQDNPEWTGVNKAF
uniref:Putative metal-dependent phosphohydrolase n=1 Tax=Aspergillus terreus TaxID=33178 RepID=L7X7M6_ASPTE|nr:putative metal-dependent phosphohydrolase [Aspergillus terreus]